MTRYLTASMAVHDGINSWQWSVVIDCPRSEEAKQIARAFRRMNTPEKIKEALERLK